MLLSSMYTPLFTPTEVIEKTAMVCECINALLGSVSPAAIVASVLAATLCTYMWYFTKFHYWKVNGFPFIKPVPLFGNFLELVLLKSLPEITDRIYEEAADLPYVGIYAFHTPVLFVKDLDLANRMLTSDFKYFEDRGFKFNSSDQLGRNLIHQSGVDWKFFRSKLTPCFSMSRVRSMVPDMVSKSKVLADSLNRLQVADVSDMALRFTVDVITLCTLGVDCDSLRHHQERFREASKQMLGFHFIYHVFLGCFLPWVHRVLGISVANTRVTRLFSSVVRDVMQCRQQESVQRKDFLNTLMQIQKEYPQSEMDKSVPSIDDDVIVAQSFIFFLAGFESPGNVLGFTLYELAKHPHIQDQLYAEIAEVLQKHDGEVNFEALQEMSYLRQVVSESLRKYVPLTLIFRRCTRDYPLPASASGSPSPSPNSNVLPAGTMVIFPLRSVHHDPRYFPDPEVFDPDRFSEEQSAARPSTAFLPFGTGPRMCPAVLYSIMKIRSAVVHIVRDLRVCLAEKTPSHVKANPLSFLFSPAGDVPLAFYKRCNYPSPDNIPSQSPANLSALQA